MRLRPLDIVCLGYVLGIAVLLIPKHIGVEDWPLLVGAHLLVAGLIVALRYWAMARPSAPSSLLGTLYPMLLLLLAWEELDALVPILYDGDYWATDLLVGADLAIFGGHPTVLVQAAFRPWLDELMAVLYTGYYLFLTVPLVLLAKGRHRAAEAAITVISLNYFSNFAVFLLLPAKSPPQILDQVAGLQASAYSGYAVAALTRAIQGSESVLGAAFPSSHVSGALVCTLLALRFAPRLGWVLAPACAGISVATVYLGYHHAVDPIAGLLWGGLCYGAGAHWLRARGEWPSRAAAARQAPAIAP